jgi:hypothetical protein
VAERSADAVGRAVELEHECDSFGHQRDCRGCGRSSRQAIHPSIWLAVGAGVG